MAVAAALDVHRLVEIARAGRVDRHERQVDTLARRRPARGGLGLGVHVRAGTSSGTSASRRIASKPSCSAVAGTTLIRRAGIGQMSPRNVSQEPTRSLS